jgi:hypothetical protein
VGRAIAKPTISRQFLNQYCYFDVMVLVGFTSFYCLEKIIMTEKLVLSQFYQLPEHLKKEVLHYITFLMKEHVSERRVGRAIAKPTIPFYLLRVIYDESGMLIGNRIY